MERKIRGLEDHETQERKRLFRDVRSPLQRMGDTLRLGHVQTGGIFAAGVCLFLFPSLCLIIPPAPVRYYYAAVFKTFAEAVIIILVAVKQADARLRVRKAGIASALEITESSLVIYQQIKIPQDDVTPCYPRHAAVRLLRSAVIYPVHAEQLRTAKLHHHGLFLVQACILQVYVKVGTVIVGHGQYVVR